MGICYYSKSQNRCRTNKIVYIFPKVIKRDLKSTINSLEIIYRFEDLYNKKDFEHIINFSDIKKGNIYINLIHYDKNLKNKENIEYYRYFSTKIIGSYCSFYDFDMLKLLISKLTQIPFPPCYILMTSGSESEKILKDFHDYTFIKDVVIFCIKKDEYLI